MIDSKRCGERFERLATVGVRYRAEKLVRIAQCQLTHLCDRCHSIRRLSTTAAARTNRCPDDPMELTVEVLGGHVGIALELLVEVDDGGGEDGEERTEAEDDDVTDGLGEGGVAPEVTLLARVLGEGGDEVIGEPLDDKIGRHGGWVGILRETAELALLLLRQVGKNEHAKRGNQSACSFGQRSHRPFCIPKI